MTKKHSESILIELVKFTRFRQLFQFAMLELIKKRINLNESKSSIIYDELPSHDPRQRGPYI